MTEPFNILTPLEGALDMAERGFCLAPTTQGQKAPPLVLDWEKCATSDPTQIRSWADAFPDCNWLVAPGRSGHVVFDVDRKNGKDGSAELERLAKVHSFDIPNTLVIATPNDGFHLYLKGTAQSSAGRIAPGIDIRSCGGYVLAPGSTVDGKVYAIRSDIEAWEETPDAPSKLLELCAKPHREDTLPSAFAGVPFTPAQLTEMLCYLDPDCSRDEWRDIAAALHAAPCTDRNFDKRELFVRWSRGEVSR